MNKRLLLVLVPVFFLIVLGGINIYRKIIWQEPTDGVSWEMKGAALTAVKVEEGSPAFLAGIKKGDTLYSINQAPVKTRIDIKKSLWLAWTGSQKLIYQINRQGELIYPSFFSTAQGSDLIYFYLALIGLTTLVIGLVVFLNSRRQFTLAFIYFYLLCMAFYSFYIFSPTGDLDVLDSMFYWLDKIAFLLFPPLLLHFFLIFPQRKQFVKNKPLTIFGIYAPGFILILAHIALHLIPQGGKTDAWAIAFHDTLEKLSLYLFTLFMITALVTIGHSALKPPNLIVKKQLKGVAFGLGVAIIPFSVFYVVPILVGLAPSKAGELSVILQALIPLTFAYSISRYRLMDFEVLLKKAATLLFSYVVIASVYFIVSAQTRFFSEYRLNALILGILAILLGATLFSPLKKLFQSLLDRVIYRQSYAYRRTLLSISKELSRERNLERLSDSLLELIANALSLRSIALLLPSADDLSLLHVFRGRGEIPANLREIRLDPALEIMLRERDFLSFYPLAERREFQKRFEALSTRGFFHVLPLRVENKLIGCLGMGKKEDDTYLTSEDWDLLTTISSSVALALENATLYNQASVRTLELVRLKDYSENIIESLTVGVAVLDQAGRIIGWNRVLENIFARKKEAVLNRTLFEVLGERTFSALFPSDTQQDFRLLSEISIDMPDGEKRIFDIARTPLFDNLMTPYGTIIVFEDTTEKIRLQQQLLTSEKLASIGLLSAGVAHEINTPLTGISSYVQMLQKKLTDKHYTQILGKIEFQTERVNRIIKNLLSFARNPSTTAFHRVDLKESIYEIISLIDYKLKTMNIALELELAPLRPLWAQGERLQQVFINIILNALDAMPGGGTLRIVLAEAGGEAVVKIKDSGSGIQPQHLPHIFDPFFTTKGIGKGTGLGLSISYAIINEHEGRISVESEAGKGTCFSIFLPLDLDRRPPRPARSADE
ncbi:MAG: ATP-binding protein [Candidatus Aminicenantes bacterium]|jgi:PAS domain S-box-containing protein|nr:ATP-binding protein [Candidatus Aminicenantes bacterium]